MTPEVRNELLAKAMVGRYRLGSIQVSLLIAGTLFETIVNLKLNPYFNRRKWSEAKIDKTPLDEKINILCDSTNVCKDSCLYEQKLRNVFKKYRPTNHIDSFLLMSNDANQRLSDIKKRLHNFRWLRNQVMHGKLTEVEFSCDNIIDDFVMYVWKEMDSGNFEHYNDKWVDFGCKGRIVERIFSHTADYMIRGIDEVDIRSIDAAVSPANDDWAITLSDFSNLFTVRDKLVSLKNYLPQWLKKTATHLHTNTLSTIDTTSAYIWMPLTSIDHESPWGIYACTVSILATPVDFRIYMDFGGMAVDYRREYYDFLSSNQYNDIALPFVAKPNFYVFDTEWFCFITKQKTMCSWLTGSSDFRGSDVKAAREEIQDYKEIVSNQITWNRMLHGYIFDRDYLDKSGCIDIELVKRCLTEIIGFNSAFEVFRSQKKEKNK